MMKWILVVHLMLSIPLCAQAIYPESFGASAATSDDTNLAALQNAIYASLGCGNGITCRTNASGLSNLNRPLVLSEMYHINGELKLYHVIGFQIICVNKLNSGIVQDAANQRIFDAQSIAYGTISNCNFSASASQTGPLIDLDYSGSQGSDLRPQNITFYDDVFSGNGITDVGVLVAKSGGGAQGDNIRCINCYFNGFTGAGWQIGGDNTGRNVGRFYAQNAVLEQIIGGDMQGNPLYGVASYGGSIEVNGTTMENDSGGFGTQTGFDVYCQAPQNRCYVRNVRSEGHKLAAGSSLLVEHSRTVWQAAQWWNGSTSLASTTPALNSLISGTGMCGDGRYYKVTGTGTFGGLGNTTATGGSTTTITASSSGWTANGFVGQIVCIISGTGVGESLVITANDTGTTITGSGGWQTQFYQLPIVTPDATSQFVVEPNWATNPTSSGTVSFALFDFDVIDNGLNAPGDLELFDVIAPGGKILSNANSVLDHVQVSRTDWSNIFLLENDYVATTFKDITISRPLAAPAINASTKYIPWGFVRNSGGNSFYKGINYENRGTKPICWSYGQVGGGPSTNDICIGIRTDNNSASSVGRAVLGILGTVGPITPFGTNQAGPDLPISGGLSTGNGAPGGISFRCGATGASGAQVNDSAECARIDLNGYKLPQFTFSTLPASPNGYTCFCTDCNSTCSAGSSTGRTCFRENGQWVH